MATINYQDTDKKGNVIHHETNSDIVLFENGNTLTEEIQRIDRIIDNIPENQPTSNGLREEWLNSCRKRLELAHDIVWTPKHNIPSPSSGSWTGFVKDVQQKGVPYSSTKQYSLHIGWHISFAQFLSCVNNPYSMIYTENLHGSTAKTAWGKTYNTNSGDIGAYYGMHCTSFVCYVVGLPSYFTTDSFNYAVKLGYMTDEGVPSVNNLREFDVIVMKNYHARVVTNLVKDSNGNITQITLEDSWMPLPKTYTLNVSEFNNKYKNLTCKTYRVKLGSNISTEYEVISSSDKTTDYTNKLCTIIGNYATFSDNDTIALSIGDNTNNVIIEKRNYSGSQENVVDKWDVKTTIQNSSAITKINLGADNFTTRYIDITSLMKNTGYGTGYYRARFSNDTNYIYFELVNTNISVTNVVGHSLRVNFDTEQGMPELIEFFQSSGGYIAKYVLTADDKIKGYADINLDTFAKHFGYYSISNYSDIKCCILVKCTNGWIRSKFTNCGLSN